MMREGESGVGLKGAVVGVGVGSGGGGGGGDVCSAIRPVVDGA